MKILIISLGSIGQRHLRNTRRLLPDSEIAVLRLKSKTPTLGPKDFQHEFFSWEEVNQFAPAAVIVASPATEHAANALPFLPKDAALFIEKPLAALFDISLQQLLAKSRESKSFIMVGYVLRFLPILHFIRNFMAQGKLGEVHTAFVQVGQYLPDWRPASDYRQGVSAQKALGGGALLELSHEIDYATWLFGHPDAVYCSCDKISDLEVDVEDSALLVMDYKKKSKKRVTIQLDFLQRTAHMSLQIVGSKGTLWADLIKEQVQFSGEMLNAPKSKDGNEIYLRQFDFFFSRAFSDYVPIFKDTKTFSDWVSLEQGADVIRLVDLAKKSNITGSRFAYE